MASWIAAATSYSTSDVPMIPFYIYYSMFGFQRVGDLAWAAGDMRARGFLIGGTAGRTTLNGEGLQHEDGHSHILSVDHPELRLLRPDLRLRGRGDRPGRPAADVRRAGGRLLLHHRDERELRAPGDAGGRGGGHRQGHVPVPRRRARRQGGAAGAAPGLGHHPARGDRRRRSAARRLGRRRRRLELPELHRAAPRGDRRRALEPAAPGGRAEGELGRDCLGQRQGPVVAATDYMRLFADQIRPYVPAALPRARHRRLRPLGLPPEAAALLRGRPALGDAGGAREPGQTARIPATRVAEAIKKYGIDPEKPNPARV